MGRVRALVRRHKKLTIAVVVALLAAVTGGVAVRCTDPEARAFRLDTRVPAPGPDFSLALFQSLGVRLLPGHELSLADNGAVFDVIVAEASRAQSSIHLLLYIWEQGVASDRVSAALVARAQAGVACRILVDDFGSPEFMQTVSPRLTRAGCEVRVFRRSPTADELARNHRKIAIFDGRVALTGGFGIRDNWLGDGVRAEGWRDTNIRFSGPAVIDAQQAFAENWQEAGGALLPADAFPAAESAGSASAAFVTSTASPVLTRAERLTQLVLAAATKRIWLANAYFVPPQAILDLLMRKASQGLDVRLLVPGQKSDSKTSFGAQHLDYGELLEQGVRVWEYSPAMMHAKTILVDDELVVVGSINLEPLSLSKLDEAALVAQDPALANRLGETFVQDCKHASELARP